MSIMSRIRNFAIAFCLVAVAACSGIPRETQQEVKALRDSFASTEAFIREQRAGFETRARTDAEINAVATRERLLTRFDTATQELARARASYDRHVKPLVDRGKASEVETLRRHIRATRDLVNAARATAQAPVQRLNLLFDAKRNHAQWFAAAPGLATAARADVTSVTTLATRYQRTYPARADAIAARLAPITATMTSIDGGIETLRAQQALAENRSPLDYGALATAYHAVTTGRTSVQGASRTLTTQLPQLDRAYSKVLSDMRETYTVCVTRTSWDEGYQDFPTETPYDYPCRQVSEDAFETAEEFADRDREIATLVAKFGGGRELRHTDLGADVATSAEVQNLWRELNIDPNASFPQGDNSATFDIREADAQFFHQYTVLEQGRRTVGGWEQVTPEFYETHYGHLGLALIEKPYGAFDDEAVTSGVPPGMTLVGDPRAGEWRSDGNGGNVWFWLYWHQALFGNNYGPGWGGYSRAEWDDWRSRRNEGAYTGRDRNNPTYGSAGSATRSGPLSGSDFGRRGGFQDASASIRGAGPSGRSGGPQSGK